MYSTKLNLDVKLQFPKFKYGLMFNKRPARYCFEGSKICKNQAMKSIKSSKIGLENDSKYSCIIQ